MDHNENTAVAVLQGVAVDLWGVFFLWIQTWGENSNSWGILLGPERLTTNNLVNPEENQTNFGLKVVITTLY